MAEFDKAADVTPDIRRVRAQRMLALTMEVVNRNLMHRPGVSRRDQGTIAAELLDAYMTAGVEVLSDYDRELFGLPPRGEKGWTVEELAAMDARRVAVFRQPPQMIVEKLDTSKAVWCTHGTEFLAVPVVDKKSDNLG